MKNLILTPHLLPTEDASRLALGKNGMLIFTTYPNSAIPNRNDNFQNQHLYLCSSEEIKDGNWYYYTGLDSFISNTDDMKNGLNTFENVNKEGHQWYKKIEFTTNPKLIAEGVLPIDGNTTCFITSPGLSLKGKSYNFLTEYCKRYNQKDTNKLDVEEEFYQIISSQRGSLPEQWKAASEKCFKVYSQALQSTGQYGLEKELISFTNWIGKMDYEATEDNSSDLVKEYLQSLQPSSKGEVCKCPNSMSSYLDDNNNFICQDCDKPYKIISKGDIVIEVEMERVVFETGTGNLQECEYKIKLTNGQPILFLK